MMWPLFLAIVLGWLAVGWAAAGSLPGLTVACALAPLFMGLTTCLAYMFIDLERYEVERGHKAVHNPLKGQVLAMNLERYGKQVRIRVNPADGWHACSTVGTRVDCPLQNRPVTTVNELEIQTI